MPLMKEKICGRQNTLESVNADKSDQRKLQTKSLRKRKE